MNANEYASSIELGHAATNHLTLIRVPAYRVIAVDGVAEPTSAQFAVARQALWRISDGLRRLPLRSDEQAALRTAQVLWQALGQVDNLGAAFRDRSRWRWQQFITVPNAVSETDAISVIARAASDAGRSTPLIRLDAHRSYRAAQLLHVGTSRNQARTLITLVDSMIADGLTPRDEVIVVRVADEDRVPAQRAASIVRVPIWEAEQ